MNNDGLKSEIYNEIDRLNKEIRSIEDSGKGSKIDFTDDKYYVFLNGKREALRFALDCANKIKEV